MKKQLLILALALGFIATTECKKNKNYSLAAGTSITVISKKMPTVPAGVTITRTNGKNRWVLMNTNAAGTPAVTIRIKKK
jgi:hypothetical protein